MRVSEQEREKSKYSFNMMQLPVTKPHISYVRFVNKIHSVDNNIRKRREKEYNVKRKMRTVINVLMHRISVLEICKNFQKGNFQF